MSIKKKLTDKINEYRAERGVMPAVAVMDAESYFELKMELFGDFDIALIEEAKTFMGVAVFYNNLGRNHISVH